MLTKFCPYPGCKEIIGISQHYCAKHQAEHDARKEQAEKQYDQHRGSPSRRGYDRDWRRLRQYKLARDPLCEDCLKQGRYVPATEVHHISKVRDRPDGRLNFDNLMSLCHECHSRRTARGE